MTEWEEMLVNQILARGVKDPKISAAMREVPRHDFTVKPESAS